jgi:hypothetical protein
MEALTRALKAFSWTVAGLSFVVFLVTLQVDFLLMAAGLVAWPFLVERATGWFLKEARRVLGVDGDEDKRDG